MERVTTNERVLAKVSFLLDLPQVRSDPLGRVAETGIRQETPRCTNTCTTFKMETKGLMYMNIIIGSSTQAESDDYSHPLLLRNTLLP